MTDNSTISNLHHEYRTLTGYDLGLDYWRERCWADWCSKGFTVEDLRLVVRWLKDGIRKETRRPGCLKFSNLIQQLDRFEEDLVEAKAELRNKIHAPTEKQMVLRATGRVDKPAPRHERTPADILAGHKAFEEFKRLKELL